MTKQIRWQKSSYSEANGPECVEVACLGQGVAFRESESPGVVCATSPRRLAALLSAVKGGAPGRGL